MRFLITGGAGFIGSHLSDRLIEQGHWVYVLDDLSTGAICHLKHRMVVPTLVSQAMAGLPLTVYGDGRQRRCFCHVADVVQALFGLMTEESAPGNVFNIGATTEISIIELAQRIIEVTGTRSEISMIPYTEAYGEGFEDMYRRVPDITKVQGRIGWRPTRSLKDIVEDVVEHQRRDLAARTPFTHLAA